MRVVEHDTPPGSPNGCSPYTARVSAYFEGEIRIARARRVACFKLSRGVPVDVHAGAYSGSVIGCSMLLT